MPETFKPIPVRPPSENRFLFWLRCIFDLQLLTIYSYLHTILPDCRGRLLDVGAGEGPWRDMLASSTVYVGVDVDTADEFGMAMRTGVTYYDGVKLPFDDLSFEQVLCTEVLEHVSNPVIFLRDIHRVLTPGGVLIMTVPWSARVHHVPNDYFRFTVFGLHSILESAGFSVECICERGNDIAVIANKMVVVSMRLFKIKSPARMLWAWPLGLSMGAIACLFLCAAHVALFFNFGSKEDPLGYGVLAKKA